MIKLLIGGSPCTFWSIAQNPEKRETTAKGLGWELFKNYLIAKEKFKPDFFLYENNVSAAAAIKNQIKRELHVGESARYIEINSKLVSAQNRKRFYVHNCGDVKQPEYRYILLLDILESWKSLSDHEQSFCLTATYNGACAWNTLERHQREMIAEPVCLNSKSGRNGVPGLQPSTQDRIYSVNGKSTAVTSSFLPKIAEPVCLYQRPHGYNKGGIKYEKTPTLTSNANWENNNFVVEMWDGKTYPCYEVKNGIASIKGKEYPISLADGLYIFRKWTVKECCRLQTMPDDYCRAVSATQAYKALGKGWTAEVIIHILSEALKDIPKNEEIVVLSMYDGIGTGRYCLDKMGFKNVKYYAYEIDKFAMKIAMSNYPDIVQKGDAFQVRNSDWRI